MILRTRVVRVVAISALIFCFGAALSGCVREPDNLPVEEPGLVGDETLTASMQGSFMTGNVPLTNPMDPDGAAMLTDNSESSEASAGSESSKTSDK